MNTPDPFGDESAKEAKPRPSLRDRALALFGTLWLVGLLTFLLPKEGVPVLWKIAWALYFGWGLVAMAASFMGNYEAWRKPLRRAQIVALLVSSLLFAIGITQFPQDSG